MNITWLQVNNEAGTLINLVHVKYILKGQSGENKFYLRFICDETDHYNYLFQESFDSEEKLNERYESLIEKLSAAYEKASS